MNIYQPFIVIIYLYEQQAYTFVQFSDMAKRLAFLLTYMHHRQTFVAPSLDPENFDIQKKSSLLTLNVCSNKN